MHANINRDPKKKHKPYTADDFMPDALRDEAELPPVTIEDFRAIFVPGYAKELSRG